MARLLAAGAVMLVHFPSLDFFFWKSKLALVGTTIQVSCELALFPRTAMYFSCLKAEACGRLASGSTGG